MTYPLEQSSEGVGLGVGDDCRVRGFVGGRDGSVSAAGGGGSGGGKLDFMNMMSE